MLDFPYYLILATVSQVHQSFPIFYTCAKTKSGYEVIADLEEFLKDGKSGLSGNILEEGSILGGVKIDDVSWRSRLKNAKFF